MRFPGNCLIVAVSASWKPGNRFRYTRNRSGRLHFFWRDRDGRGWRFYKKGASTRSYLRNSLYVGEIKQM